MLEVSQRIFIAINPLRQIEKNFLGVYESQHIIPLRQIEKKFWVY